MYIACMTYTINLILCDEKDYVKIFTGELFYWQKISRSTLTHSLHDCALSLHN